MYFKIIYGIFFLLTFSDVSKSAMTLPKSTFLLYIDQGNRQESVDRFQLWAIKIYVST